MSKYERTESHLFYKLKNEEWQLLNNCYRIFFNRLSPVARVRLGNLLTILKKDMIIITSEQANDIFSLLAFLSDKNASDLEEETNELPSKKKHSKKNYPQRFDSKIITGLIESMRIFLEQSNISLEKSMDTKIEKSL